MPNEPEGAQKSPRLSFALGLAAVAARDFEGARREAASLKTARTQFAAANQPYRAKLIEIMELEVTAAADVEAGKLDEAVDALRRATALEEAMSPPSGPPETIKPSHELFGEVLLRAGRAREAAAQFASALLRQPNRPRSLLGAARAAAQLGDKPAAAARYTLFLSILGPAEVQLPELQEARDFLKQNPVR